MKYIISLSLLLLSTPVFAQWRDIKISSYTDIRAIQENFRRASLYSNRKLDKYSNETLYGNLTLSDDHKYYGDGTALTGVSVLAATQTFSGENTFGGTTSTTTFSGWVDIGLEVLYDGTSTEVDIQSCSAGKRLLGGGCYALTALLMSYPYTETSWKCQTTAGQPTEATAICARVK